VQQQIKSFFNRGANVAEREEFFKKQVLLPFSVSMMKRRDTL
jgi:hypothetical protein